MAVSASARITPDTPTPADDAQRDRWKAALDEVSASDVRAVATLGHCGPRGATRGRVDMVDVPLPHEGAWEIVAASALPYTPRSAVPTPMDRGRMDSVIDDFVAAAGRTEAAGFDMIELHMGHGYLLGSFISPLTNERSDSYGGSIENRLRYPLEVFEAVHDACRIPIGVALNVSDWAPGGTTPSDAVIAAEMLKERGCVFVRVLAGQTTAQHRPRYDPYFLTHYADRVRNEAMIATIATGDITTVDHANTIVAGGRADVCLLRSSSS
jgi:anthraniloyl-CoA monooxygenase